MQCSAAGDVFGGGGGEPGGVRGDADTAEVESVGVEADGEGGVGLGLSTVVDSAGGDEEVHAGVVEVEMAVLAECEGEACTARAVLWIVTFVFAAGVVEKGEEADDFLVGRVLAGQEQSVAQHGAPVGGAVDRFVSKAEPGGDELPEGNFSGQEIGEHVFRRMV